MTYVDVLRQEVVGGLVLAEKVRVDSGAGQDGAEEEAEEPTVCGPDSVSKSRNMVSVCHLSPQAAAPFLGGI